MGNRVHLRVLEAADVGAITAVYVGVFNSPRWNDGWSVEAARERLGGIATARRSFTGSGMGLRVPVG